MVIPRIAISTGEPAGIGPELCAALVDHKFDAELVLVGDPLLLEQRAAGAYPGPTLTEYRPGNDTRAGGLCVLPVSLSAPVTAGQLNSANAGYVLQTLDRSVQGCLDGEFQALVTAPVHKGIINTAGIPFTGHTEYLAAKSAVEQVVMMLVAPGLRVALATTHLPLSAVATSITRNRLEATLRCLHSELETRFRISGPRILVAGLNPHAGEDGYLGREEIDIIEPVIRSLQQQGMQLTGPLPADTLFTPPWLEQADAVLAMYHDQGLPVLKHIGFGQSVNITLGLPFIRTSVDHGTALDKAGSGEANIGSLTAAIKLAIQLGQGELRSKRGPPGGQGELRSKRGPPGGQGELRSKTRGIAPSAQGKAPWGGGSPRAR
ncbi:MAG: 4-hydroxythreonine-4-phosphate dehydrogenase PdxA [Thermotogales bacterium]|nr:4-hydroxythreonine-4-phosphate dehydrogenase PdxA [Thermotogales bacterium]